MTHIMRKTKQKRPVSKFRNETPVTEVLKECKKSAKMKDVDFKNAHSEMNINWIDTLLDLRHLHREKLLSELEIEEVLIEWISKQCELDFEEVSGDILRFVYQEDFDQNGILYWLGTNGKTKPWSNPSHLKEVKLESSPLMRDSKDVSAIVGREAVRCVTKPVDKSWFQIDFLHRKIKPKHYMLRHYITWDSEAMRNWKFEGSNSGDKWDLLREHVKDESLCAKGQSHTWELDTQEFYSMFRILQTGVNSNQHNYLALSGFEIYGEMKTGKMQSEVSVTEKRKVFKYISNFDTNGIVYWLGTGKGTRAYTNPADEGLIKIYISSLSQNSDNEKYLVGREEKRVVTEPKKMSWFCIDFKDIMIQPTYYMLRHYSTFDTEALRHWKLEGSNDTTDGWNGTWTLVKWHKNDKSLVRKGQAFTWPISNCKLSFSKFRILQINTNSNSHHYLACSGFEIYGTITQMQDEPRQMAPVNKRTFRYSYDMDEKGILYYLGTEAGRLDWINPMDKKLVIVTASTVMNNSSPMSAVVGRRVVRCVTKPHAKSWIMINFSPNSVCPNAYTLRHYASWDTEALRCWNFEGSNDGLTWRVINKHTNDTSLNKAGATHTWKVECDRAYTHFRIYMTNRNSNDHWYLSCSGFEIYGDASGPCFGPNPDFRLKPLAQQGKDVQVQAPVFGAAGRRFAWHQDMDENGLCYYLGTNFLTQPWQNPNSTREHIELLGSGLMENSAPLSSVVGREAKRCVTKPTKNAWVSISFGPYFIRPSHYTLRHYSSWDTEALRNWRLEGSLDREVWTVLREHKKDASLNKKGQTHTWTLKCSQAYNNFRIIQFDKNSNQHLYLAISGFEIYGDVYTLHSSLGWSEKKGKKSKYLQVDSARNLVQDMYNSEKCPWQTVLSDRPITWENGKDVSGYSLLIDKPQNTTNLWKILVGVAPEDFDCTGNKQWLGSQRSWAYIAGTGGKCYNKGQSLEYGWKWGEHAGDVITVQINRKKGTLEFFVNGMSQGIAFDNIPKVQAKLYAACSLTAYKASVVLVEELLREKRPDLVSGGAKMSVVNDVGKWNSKKTSSHLKLHRDKVTITNKGSNNTWQCAVGRQEFRRGRHSFAVEMMKDASTTNTWRVIVGVVPQSFDVKETGWLGSQSSWGYIAGTGGKCHNEGKSEDYGEKYGHRDVITVELDFDNKTITFYKNGKSQGVAFRNLKGPVYPAVSFCGTNTSVRLKPA